jgi:hypothetical protein
MPHDRAGKSLLSTNESKHFRLTFVFNAFKTPPNFYLNSLQALNLSLFFKIRGVISVRTCLEGGNLVNLTMHAPWCITGCPSNIFHQTTCKGQAWGAAKALFFKNIMEACEAREHGSDSKQKHQVGGPIMQAKEWTWEFGRCNPVEHVVTKQQSKSEYAGEKLSQEECGRPQAGRPRPAGLPLF